MLGTQFVIDILALAAVVSEIAQPKSVETSLIKGHEIICGESTRVNISSWAWKRNLVPHGHNPQQNLHIPKNKQLMTILQGSQCFPSRIGRYLTPLPRQVNSQCVQTTRRDVGPLGYPENLSDIEDFIEENDTNKPPRSSIVVLRFIEYVKVVYRTFRSVPCWVFT